MADTIVNSQANALRVLHVEKSFGSGALPLRKPDRILLGEGVLTKVCRKDAKPRQFFLFNDILVYGSIVQDKKRYTKQHIIELQDLAIVPLPDTEQYRHAWQLCSSHKSFVVLAATAQEKAEWISRLSKASGRQPLKPGQRLAEHAPAWVPDHSATACMHCEKLGRVKKFSPLVRKHHCRNCGDVVCAQCSSQKYLLEHQSKKPQRVCQSCFQRLSLGVPNDNQVAASDDPEDATPHEDDEEDAVSVDLAQVTNFKEASSTLQDMVAEHPTTFFDQEADNHYMDLEAP